MKKVKGNLDTSTLSLIFALAWPTMLSEFLGTAIQYIDTAMVGSLGTYATAAVGSTSTVNWLVGSTVSAIGVGFLAYISQAFGAKEPQRAKKASAQAVTVTLVSGIVFTAIIVPLGSYVPTWMNVDPLVRKEAEIYFKILYAPMLFRTASIILGMVLRSAGDTKTPMRVGILTNVLDVVLNFLLIYPTREISIFNKTIKVFGYGLGVRGAALASAICYTVGGVLISFFLFKHKTISPKGYSFKPDKSILKPAFKVAIPNIFQRFATSFGYVAFASMINRLGEVSTAAHTIANTVESAFYIPGWGMQTAAATLSGNAYGAKDSNKLKALGKTIIPLEISLMTISGSLLFIFATPLMKIFSKDLSVIILGTTVLKMVAISEPFYGVPIVIEGILQGMGRTVVSFIFTVSSMWGVRILGTYVCTCILGYGLVSAWGAMIAHNLLLFVLFLSYYLSSKKPL
ncbi:MAG: MATE family efflux transporter [Sphaerochaetaceae bacterium]|nr:MATE family efflux transporter [Sphaerochaetaceae bacterium]